jgi:hypothetical protein
VAGPGRNANIEIQDDRRENDMEIFIALVVAILVITVVLRRQRHRAWRRFARRHGLTYRRGTSRRPQVTGRIDGRPCRLRISDQSSDTGLAGVEVVELSIEADFAAPPGLEIRAGTKIDPLVGDEGVATGDDAFDDRLRVKGENEEQILEFLDPVRRRTILDLFDGADPGTALLRGAELSIRRRRAVSRLADVEADLALLVRVARRLEGLS